MPQFSLNTTAAVRKPNWHTAKMITDSLNSGQTLLHLIANTHNTVIILQRASLLAFTFRLFHPCSRSCPLVSHRQTRQDRKKKSLRTFPIFFLSILIRNMTKVEMTTFFSIKYKTGDRWKGYMCTQIKGFSICHLNTVSANL